MLEVCFFIVVFKLCLEVYFLGIGICKSQIVCFVFILKVGLGCIVIVVDLGNCFCLIVNDVECIELKLLFKLLVVFVLWILMFNFEVGVGVWILVGGIYYFCFFYDLIVEYWEDYVEIVGIEMICIDKDIIISNFKKEFCMNEVYYMLNKVFC